MPFFMPLFARGGAVQFIAADRATTGGAARPFPAGVAVGDLALAFYGGRQSPRVQSGGTYWARGSASHQTSYARTLTAADLSSGYTPDDEVILAIWRGARSVAFVGGEDVGQGPTRQVASLTKPPGHAGLVIMIYGAGPTNSPGIGSPVDPAPYAQRILGGYSLPGTDFTTGIWDRLAPLYVDGAPITWTPSASDGNGIAVFQLIA